MSPVAYLIPGVGIALWWHALLLGAVLAAAVAILPGWMARLEHLDRRRTRLAIICLALAVLTGGRVHFWLNHRELFERVGPTAWLAGGGLHAGGAVLALVLCAPIILAALRLDAGRFLDGLVPFAGIGIAVARLGCFLHGCCFGLPSAAPWAVRYPPDSPAFVHHGQIGLVHALADASAAVHPLPLYFAAIALLIAALAMVYRRQRAFAGEVAAVALAFFGLASAGLELLRAELPGRPYLWGAPQLFWIALGLAGLGITAIALGRLGARRAPLLSAVRVGAGVSPPRSRSA